MVDITGVTVKYKKTVLDDVNIRADKGEVIGLLGLNGSGKSTLLSAIAGIKKVQKGKITVDGRVGFVTQENALIDELNAYDNILMWTPLKKDEIISALKGPDLSILKVADFLNVKVKNMSGGMKKRLSLSSVFINRPDILLLDEPLAALDLQAKSDILKFIDRIRSEGGTVFIASHEREVYEHCDKVYHLKDSRCSLLSDKALLKEVLDDPDLL